MAKKVVASLQKGTKNYAKVIKMVRSQKTGSYTFKEEIVAIDKAKEYFEKK